MLLRATRLGDLRRSTLSWCRRNRTSACNAARDRNSPITADQINLQRSLIGRMYQPISRALVSRFDFAVGTAANILRKPDSDRLKTTTQGFKIAIVRARA